MKKVTVQKCKSILFKLGIKYGVSPALISSQLLSDDDKEDMQNGLVPFDTLDIAVKLWLEAGCPDYVSDKGDVS